MSILDLNEPRDAMIVAQALESHADIYDRRVSNAKDLGRDLPIVEQWRLEAKRARELADQALAPRQPTKRRAMTMPDVREALAIFTKATKKPVSS
jgi:hypothetical protein